MSRVPRGSPPRLVVADRYGSALVGAQLASIAGLAWPGRRRWPLARPVKVAAAALAAGGGCLAAAGVAALGQDASPLPAPPPGAPLRRAGVYGVVRHPIYVGLLVSAAGVAVWRARPEPLLAVGALSVVLHHKVGHEERLLRHRFGPTYDDYARRVPRLVPRLVRR